MKKEKELVKNTAIISLGKICTQCISFFLLPLYTSILSTSEYGTVDLVVSYSSLILPIITMAVEQALFRYLIDVRTEKDKKAAIVSSTLLFASFQCFICLMILLVVQLVIENKYMPYFILMVIACTFSATMLQLSRGLGDNKGYALGSFITAAVQVICNVVYLVVLNLGPQGMLLASITGNVACVLILFCKTKTYKYFNVRLFDFEILKRMLKYSIPLIPNQLSWWAMNASDKTVVAIFLGTASNGLLAIAHKFPSMYMQFSSIFSISWTESAVMHINDDDAESFFTGVINTVFRLFMCACMGIIVCIPFVFGWLINERYYDAYYQIPIFMVASLCSVVVSLYGVIYVAYKKTADIAYTAIYSVLITILTHLLMIKFIGLYASAVSSLLGYGTMAVYRYFHSRRYLTVKISNMTLHSTLFLIAVSFITYYMRNLILHIVGFSVVLVIAIALNRSVLKRGASLIIKSINRIKY